MPAHYSGEPLRTWYASALQKRLWGTTEDLRGQHIAETVRNCWGHQRVAHCSRSCEDLRGQHISEAVRNYWGPQRATRCRSCEELLRTSEGNTLQKKLWGTTEDLRGQHIAEAVRNYRGLLNYWGPQRVVHWSRKLCGPQKAASTLQKKLWFTTSASQKPSDTILERWKKKRVVCGKQEFKRKVQTVSQHFSFHKRSIRQCHCFYRGFITFMVMNM